MASSSSNFHLTQDFSLDYDTKKTFNLKYNEEKKHGTKKRSNVKEEMKLQYRLEKRIMQSEQDLMKNDGTNVEEETGFEVREKVKKYDNGKPKKGLKGMTEQQETLTD